MSKKISFEFSNEAYEALERMKNEIDDCVNKADVVRRGLRLLDYYQEQLSKGNKFCLKDINGSVQEVEVLF